MVRQDQQDWLTRKRTEFGSFDLSALNFLGWLLFLSTLLPLVVGVVMIVQSGSMNNQPGGNNGSRGTQKLYAALVLVVMVAWFHLGKFLLNLAGISIYRASRR
jgi:hypothetical protein